MLSHRPISWYRYIIRGGLAGPPGLLLDEPTSGLDPSASHEFSVLLKKLSTRGVAILMATHDLFRAQEDATRVGIMRHGKLAHILTAAELRHTDLEKLYLEAMAA
jgi:ABC-2 type transport system ATP-binding protein